MPNFKYQKKRNRRRNSRPRNAPKLPITINASQLDIVGGAVIMSAEFDQPISGWVIGQVKAPQLGVSARLTRATGPATHAQFDLVATEVRAVSLTQFEFKFDPPAGGVAAGDVVQLAFSEACASWAFNPSAEGVRYLADDVIAQPIEPSLVVTKMNGSAAPEVGPVITSLGQNQTGPAEFEIIIAADGPVTGWSEGPVYPETLPNCPGLTVRVNVQGELFPCVITQAVFDSQQSVVVTAQIGGGGSFDVPMTIECAFDDRISACAVASDESPIPASVLAVLALMS